MWFAEPLGVPPRAIDFEILKLAWIVETSGATMTRAASAAFPTVNERRICDRA